jgi:hypothetical protein
MLEDLSKLYLGLNRAIQKGREPPSLWIRQYSRILQLADLPATIWWSCIQK